MSTERIDVLAVMDAAIERNASLPSVTAQMSEARAAVAELIEAADKVQLAYALMNLDPDFIRLRKALARVGGA